MSWAIAFTNLFIAPLHRGNSEFATWRGFPPCWRLLVGDLCIILCRCFQDRILSLAITSLLCFHFHVVNKYLLCLAVISFFLQECCCLGKIYCAFMGQLREDAFLDKTGACQPIDKYFSCWPFKSWPASHSRTIYKVWIYN